MSSRIVGAGSIGLLAALLLSGCEERDPQLAALPDELDFNWHVRPILSDNCFRCHGPDANTQEAGLRLDMREPAVGELPESPGKYAIVPGDPEASELIRRVTADNPDVRMPPLQTHKVLTETQVSILTQWIDDGAEYKPHWSFITPEKPDVPMTDFDDRTVNEVDHFVFARLEQEGLALAPAPEADRETLINRVTLSLTGLPPTLEEVDAFLADASPNAYEKVVDRALASPAYGERMATYWMDLARFSESDGFLDDHHDRFLWPWRDWVIDAFDQNMPFDEFSTWQLTGDLLPDHTRDQLLATAFLRVGPRTTENGAIDEEYRVEYAIERADTVGNAFLGLTTGCARCHDHKYDPISQADYYSLTGFFNSTDEPGFYPPGHSAIQAGPTMPWPSSERRKEIEVAETSLSDEMDRYQAVLGEVRERHGGSSIDARGVADELQQSLDQALVAYYPFETTEPIPDSDLESLLIERKEPPQELVTLVQRPRARDESEPQGPRVPSGYVRELMVYSPAGNQGAKPAVLQAPILKRGVEGQALYFDEGNKGFLGKGVGFHDRTHDFTLDLWFKPDRRYPEKIPVLNHRDDDNSGGAGYRLELEDGKLHFYMAHSRPFNMIAVAARDELPVKQWSHITLVYDGSSRAAGIKLHVNGEETPVDVIRDNLTRSSLPRSYAPIFDNFVGVAFGQRFREKSPVGAGLDEVRVFDRALAPIEVAFLHDPTSIPEGDQLHRQMVEVRVSNDPAVEAAKADLIEARENHNQLVTLVLQVLVMGDRPKPRPTYRLERGLYSERGEEVPVQALAQIFPWDESLPSNRIGLAKWLFDPQNPLTSRVFVNRIWQLHFGRGLVETSEDFGAQGSLPTHPELLDWLAVRFIESGWDIKALHKLLVMSATFRQRSDITEEMRRGDPTNTLLARGVRRRMPAEMVRDNALAAAGLLVDKIGGPSVYPHQPEGVWSPLNSFSDYPTPDSLPDDDQHRRSLYTFIKRSAPHPGMENFDLADRSVSTSRRTVSNTPLQALQLMNDPQFVEAYRQIAARVAESDDETQAQLTRIFRLARREYPTDEQLDVLQRYFEEQREVFADDPDGAKALVSVGVAPVAEDVDPVTLAALTNVAAVVMNTPDAYMIR